jgi:hypothetical protein
MNEIDRAMPIEVLQAMFGGSVPYGAALSFYLDESIDTLISDLLHAEAIPASSVYEHHQLGEASDMRVLAKSRELGSIFVTTISRFEAVHHHLISINGLVHPGIVLVRSRAVRQPRGHLAALLGHLADRFEGFPDCLENGLYRL